MCDCWLTPGLHTEGRELGEGAVGYCPPSGRLVPHQRLGRPIPGGGRRPPADVGPQLTVRSSGTAGMARAQHRPSPSDTRRRSGCRPGSPSGGQTRAPRPQVPMRGLLIQGAERLLGRRGWWPWSGGCRPGFGPGTLRSRASRRAMHSLPLQDNFDVTAVG